MVLNPNSGRTLTGAIVEEPMVRNGTKMQYYRIPPIELSPIMTVSNLLRDTATARRVSHSKQKSGDEAVGRIPGWKYGVPEDGRRYELMIKGDDGVAKYQVMVDSPGTVEKMMVHIKGTGKNLILPGSKNNRYFLGTAFKDYSLGKNKPIRADALFNKLRDDDVTPPEIEKSYDKLREGF